MRPPRRWTRASSARSAPGAGPGSRYTEYVTVHRQGGTGADAAFCAELAAELEPYRMAGSDVVVQPPVYVPVDIGLTVCVAPGYFRGTVKVFRILMFSTRDLPGGGRGFSSLATSPLPSRSTSAPWSRRPWRSPESPGWRWSGSSGPASRLAPQLAAGLIAMDRLEVARCDSEAVDPAAGRISFTMTGGL